MNLIEKAMNLRIPIRLYYESPTSRHIRTRIAESPVSDAGNKPAGDSLATSGQVSATIVSDINEREGPPLWEGFQIVSDDGVVWFDGERDTPEGVAHKAEVAAMRLRQQST
jgi:hypothetical protein